MPLNAREATAEALGPARPARGRRTREAGTDDPRCLILDAAEALFAEHGFDGVTVRAVTRRCGVDVALAHYYFASKRGLFDAVFLRRAEVLNAERLAAITAYEGDPGPGGATPEGLIDAFLAAPLERWHAGGPGWKSYLAIVAQVNNTPHWGGETMARYFDPVIHRLIEGLRPLMPRARDVDLFWSYQFLSGALTLVFAETGRIDLLSGGLCRSGDYPAVRARLARFVAAGFRALCETVAVGADAE